MEPEPPIKQSCKVSDVTTEGLIPVMENNPYGLCAIYNEGMTFFGGLDAYRSGGGSKDEGLFNEFYDGGHVEVTRKSGDVSASHSHCSICAGIQPKTFNSTLRKNPQFLYSGFFSRFLLCMPPDIPRYIHEEFVPEDVENAYHRMINVLFSWRKKVNSTPDVPCCLSLTPEARAIYDEYHDEIASERASLPSGVMKATLSKLIGYAMRIALTLHVADFASSCRDGQIPQRIPKIGVETIKAAITLTKWYRREAQRVLQMACPGEIIVGDKEVAAILSHIQKHGQTTARKIAQNIKAFDGAGGSEKTSLKLEEMASSGLLIHDDQPLTKRVYFLHNATFPIFSTRPTTL